MVSYLKNISCNTKWCSNTCDSICWVRWHRLNKVYIKSSFIYLANTLCWEFISKLIQYSHLQLVLCYFIVCYRLLVVFPCIWSFLFFVEACRWFKPKLNYKIGGKLLVELYQGHSYFLLLTLFIILLFFNKSKSQVNCEHASKVHRTMNIFIKMKV